MTWHAKSTGAYTADSPEAMDNAQEIRQILEGLGWTVNAISGLLGNIHVESGYNPWRYQNDDVQSFESSKTWGLGYGFVQWSPCRKYLHNPEVSGYIGYDPNFSDRPGAPNDGSAQAYAVDGMPGQWAATSSYPISYDEFKASTGDPGELAMAFLLNYERPGDPAATEATRRQYAAYWYEYLTGHDPPGPGPDPTTKTHRPLGLGFRRRKMGRRKINE